MNGRLLFGKDIKVNILVQWQETVTVWLAGWLLGARKREYIERILSNSPKPMRIGRSDED